MTLYVDCEFYNTSEEKVTPVCAAIFDSRKGSIHKFWTHNNPLEIKRFKEYCLKNINEEWFSYAATAEGRFWISVDLDPVKFKWIDGFLEYRLLTNHNDKLAYGEQLVNGKIKTTKRPLPKWERTEEDSMGSFKATHSLAEATFKLTKVIRDTDHKNKMRDILISGDAFLVEQNKDDILNYCIDDTRFLPNIHKGMKDWYKKLLTPEEQKTLPQEMLLRGKYASLNALMESTGYPINVEQTKNFSDSVAPILEECQREINELFPDIKPFKWKKTDGKFSWDQLATKKWIEANCNADKWMRTDSGSLSLCLEAFQRNFDFKHDYPKDNFGAQIVRYLKLKQNLNGFSKNPKKKSFWDSVGSDGRVRPYMNIYGAQSSRSQPSATGFLFLKPAWMRSLCQPKKGKAIASFDYGSQEFLISALISNDKNMLWAYQSGDVYLAFGKLAGAIPPEGTKKTHAAERDLFKATTLGVSYLMTKIGLAAKLSSDTGRDIDEDAAQDLINLFYESYPDFSVWQSDAIENYMQLKKKVKLPCGWIMFADNDNFRSAVNCPIQGRGASAMRKAVEFCYEAGLKVILTLHDAIYIEYDEDDLEAIDKLYDCMFRGFIHYFEDKKAASSIRLDGKAWGSGYSGKSELITPNKLKIECSEIFIDARAKNEYDQFSKYFEPSGAELL
jgi:DNA polymerase family A